MINLRRFGRHRLDPPRPGGRRLGVRGLVVLVAALFATGVCAVLFVQPASAHGSAIGPSSRHYGCWERWGDDFQNPDMAQEDPMCWQAWQADTNAMWNWNGLYREQVGGDHQGAIPDDQLCSGGRTGGTRYAALDEPGPWKTTQVDSDFTFTNWDQANHGADYYRIYVTRQGYDAQTDALDWADLELLVDTGDIDPGVGRTPPSGGGTLVDIDVSAPGRTGHHVVYMIWQASHFDQSFYSCSDVWFGEGGPSEEPGDPADDPTEDPTGDPTEDPVTEDPTGDPTTDLPEGISCEATATVNSWGSGATVSVTVANTGSQDLHNWMLHWTWPSADVTVDQIWSAEHSTMGGTEMAAPVSYNREIPVGGSVEFGFNASGPLSGAPEFDCIPA